MNQKSRQKATSSVERDFYKLLKNSNFGIDCRNNVDNCVLEPLFNDFEEIFYIKKFTTIFNDDTFRDFFLPALLRDVIFEVITATKIYKRFDSSHEFWDIFGFRKENRRKKLRYYKIESINNPCLATIAVNPKEYLEVRQDLKLNKKHKGIKNGSNGMGFENFANRIKPLVNFDTFQKLPAEYKQVSRLTVDKGEMVKKTVTKTKFSELNDKRFYFPNGILSLPFDHENVKEIDDFKQKKVRKLKIIFGRRKKSC